MFTKICHVFFYFLFFYFYFYFFYLCGENYALCRGISEFLSVLSTFIVCFGWNVVKRSALDAHFQIWLTCGTRDLYVMLLSICKFLEYWDREGHTFIMALRGITFLWVP